MKKTTLILVGIIWVIAMCALPCICISNINSACALQENQYESQTVSSANHTLSISLSQPVNLISNKTIIAKPNMDQTIFEYDGNEKTYYIEQNEYMSVLNNKQTEPGVYYVIVQLVDKENCTWDDGTTSDLLFSFEIHQFEFNWIWSENYLSATLNISCQNSSCEYTASLNAHVVSYIEKNATTTSNGILVYQASTNFNNVIRTDYKKVPLAKLSSNLSSDDGSIQIYSDAGFSNEKIEIEDIESIDLPFDFGDAQILMLKSINIASINDHPRDFIVSFDVAKFAKQYKDFTIIKVDYDQGVKLETSVLNGKAECRTSTLGTFIVIGIDKTNIPSAQYIVTFFIIVSLCTIAVLLTIMFIAKSISLKRTRLAIERY